MNGEGMLQIIFLLKGAVISLLISSRVVSGEGLTEVFLQFFVLFFFVVLFPSSPLGHVDSDAPL